MFKRFRSLFITFAILGSLVILTGTRYSSTTLNPSPSITDDGTTITLTSPLVFDANTGTAGTLARWPTATTLAGGSILDDGSSLVHFNFDNDGIDFRVDTENGIAFFIDADVDVATFSAPQGHANSAVALGAAAVTFSAGGNFVTVTGDAGTNTIATITSGTTGEILTLLFTDALVTITDTGTQAANTVDLDSAFTSADDVVLTLLYDGTSWYEVGRSVAGAAGISGSGTTGTLPVWTSSSALGDSIVSESGTVLTIANSISIATQVTHTGDTDTFIAFTSNIIDFDAGGIEILSLDHGTIDPQGLIFNTSQDADMDFRIATDNIGTAFFMDAGADAAEFNVPLQVNNIILETDDTHDIGTSTVGLRDIFMNGKIAVPNAAGTSITMGASLIDMDLSTVSVLGLSASAGAIFNETGEGNFDFRVETNNVINALFIDSGAETAAWNVPQGHGNTAVALGAAAVTFSAATNFVTVTGDAGTNTIATITSGTVGETVTLLFVDSLVTITDDDSHAADSVDLSAALTGADDTTLTLLYDGTSWYELSRSVN